jgi:hypothetical protein
MKQIGIENRLCFNQKISFESLDNCRVYQWLNTGFGLLIGFINYLQVVTTINYYSTADLHNLQSLHNNILSLFPLVFIIRFLATDL